MKLPWLERAAWAALLFASICFNLGKRDAVETLSKHNVMLAADYQALLVADNRMTRSKTDFQYPKMGEYEFTKIDEAALAMKWPKELICAAETAENGGMLLETGQKSIGQEIRKFLRPQLFQRAGAAQLMQREAANMILHDPEVTYVFAAHLARGWKAANPDEWRDNFIAALNRCRGEGQAVRASTPKTHKKPAHARRKKR